MLTARVEESDRLLGLEVGADDYITKPFSTAEFQARIRAQLRRARLAGVDEPNQPIAIDGVTIDVTRPAVTRNGTPVHLTKTEWELLRVLVAHRGRTLTHRELFTPVWGNSFGDAQQYLRVHIRSLRRKLEPDPVRPRLIVTEPGVGYRFEGEG
jgi:two-component system KDP operon response regulator KdpE